MSRDLSTFALKAAIIIVPLGLWAPDVVRAAAVAWTEGRVAAYATLFSELGVKDPVEARQAALGTVVAGK